ncbi:unnamed protein product, partial [Prorocentrum cordatum]
SALLPPGPPPPPRQRAGRGPRGACAGGLCGEMIDPQALLAPGLARPASSHAAVPCVAEQRLGSADARTSSRRSSEPGVTLLQGARAGSRNSMARLPDEPTDAWAVKAGPGAAYRGAMLGRLWPCRGGPGVKKRPQRQGGRCLAQLLAALRGRRWLRVSSACAGSVARVVAADQGGDWSVFCPCCKRPLALRLQRLRCTLGCGGRRPASAARFAYVAVLWGSDPDYVLGAMVLARSLRASGTAHDLVLLHTAAVPEAAAALLRRAGWQTREVETVRATDALSSNACPRFVEVFTKLHALGLVEYDKVLLVDVDTVVTGSTWTHSLSCARPQPWREAPAPGTATERR